MIYVLLIFVALQIIGVYFVGKLEDNLVNNFQTSIKGHVNLLTYSIGEEMIKERGKDDPTLEEAINTILKDKDTISNNISEVQVIDTRSSRVIGTSRTGNQSILGKKTTESTVKRTLVGLEDENKVYRDAETGRRVWVLSTPIEVNGEVIGAVYLIAEMENVFEQMDQINNIFITGTAIALGITAILGIFLARTITRPMSDMRKQALAMSKGNFSRKVKVYSDDEIGQLAVTFNDLTKKLQDSQSSTEGERRKLSSVLANMTDGVISTDRRGTCQFNQ